MKITFILLSVRVCISAIVLLLLLLAVFKRCPFDNKYKYIHRERYSINQRITNAITYFQSKFVFILIENFNYIRIVYIPTFSNIKFAKIIKRTIFSINLLEKKNKIILILRLFVYQYRIKFVQNIVRIVTTKTSALIHSFCI